MTALKLRSLLLCALTLSVGNAFAASPAVIPMPAHVTPSQGSFRLQANTTLVAQAGAEGAARYFADLMSHSPGIRFARSLARPGRTPGSAAAIVFTLRKGALGSDPEGYSLDISPAGIRASAADPRGLLYAAVTLWQLCTADPGTDSGADVPAMHIEDTPRFRWRGLMLDSARHYQSPQDIEDLLDWMALHKLNTLHWHLTDDQAWRLEIKRYPRLTSIGAWRVEAGAGPASDLDPRTGQPRKYGGYYSQRSVRRIVAHAAQRNVTIVPEIDLPAHVTAALVAYPELSALQPAPSRVPADWGIYPNLLNAEEGTFEFLERVLSEVIELFPGPYVHLGGDEVSTEQWKYSPRVRQRMRALGIGSEKALHGYFVTRMGRFLLAHGRRPIGWDEILEAGLPPQAAVTSWRGIEGAIKAAAGGHDSVLSPDPTMYLDHLNGDLPDEPPGRGPPLTLETMYRFDPLAALSAADARHILGLQANLWTEHVATAERVQLMLFPRAAAVAEVGWSPARALDWGSFVARLPAQLARYRALGIHASDDIFAVLIRAHRGVNSTTQPAASESPPVAPPGRARVELAKQAASGDIRYTLDGSDPGPGSAQYLEEIEVPARGSIRAAAFMDGRRISRITAHGLDAPALARRTSRELRSCSGKLLLSLQDDAPVVGPRAIFSVDIMNPCWIYEGADLSQPTAVRAAVGQLPFNFQLGADIRNVHLNEPHSASGELEVRLDGCGGERIAELSLQPALNSPAVTELPAQGLPTRAGRHDLCLRFTQPALDPMWVLDWIQLVESS